MCRNLLLSLRSRLLSSLQLLPRLVLPTLLLSMLAACDSLTTLDGRPVVELAAASPTRRLLEPCAGPQQLPNRAIRRSEAARAWGRDRAALVECGERHDAVVTYYQERDSGLADVK